MGLKDWPWGPAPHRAGKGLASSSPDPRPAPGSGARPQEGQSGETHFPASHTLDVQSAAVKVASPMIMNVFSITNSFLLPRVPEVRDFGRNP